MKQQIGTDRQYKSLWSAFVDIIKKEGYLGLYKGVIPTVSRLIFIVINK